VSSSKVSGYFVRFNKKQNASTHKKKPHIKFHKNTFAGAGGDLFNVDGRTDESELARLKLAFHNCVANVPKKLVKITEEQNFNTGTTVLATRNCIEGLRDPVKSGGMLFVTLQPSSVKLY